MDFFSIKGKRPVRLKESTRALAARALSGEFGQDAFHTPFVEITEPSYEKLSTEEQYVYMLKKIVSEAPLRIIPASLLWARLRWETQFSRLFLRDIKVKTSSAA